MNTGEMIRRERKKKGLSMKKLGSMIGVSEQAISQYERGLRRIPLEIILKISDSLEVELNKIYEADDKTIHDIINTLPKDHKLSDDELDEKNKDAIRLLNKISFPDIETNPLSQQKAVAYMDTALKITIALNEILPLFNISYNMNMNNEDGIVTVSIYDKNDNSEKEISLKDFTSFSHRLCWVIEKEIEFLKHL